MRNLNGSKNIVGDQFSVRVLRQDRPGLPKLLTNVFSGILPKLECPSVLQYIAAHPQTALGRHVAPVAYESNCLEEVSGACTMLINGYVRQACTAFVDRLLAQTPHLIELRPMSKFPVIRDLIVDRRRLFRALEKLQGWIPVGGYYDAGPGPRQSQEKQQLAYTLSKCMSCGCCLEACPQYTRVALNQQAEETNDQFKKREDAAFDDVFIGFHANNQIVLTNSHPTGHLTASQRMDALIAPGGIQNCGKAANCQAVCPQEIPLLTSWGRAGRAATVHMIKKFFDG